eukprot:68260-Chlamydomonas_euryale.AAC.2
MGRGGCCCGDGGCVQGWRLRDAHRESAAAAAAAGAHAAGSYRDRVWQGWDGRRGCGTRRQTKLPGAQHGANDAAAIP